jgi:two-component system, sensor histidine kinase and response regulator
LLAVFIKNLGYKVFEAATGLEAVNRASIIHPDLIVMDLALPGMSGEKAMKCLKANPTTRDIPVPISTACAGSIDTQRALDSSAAEVLLKPLNLTNLCDVLCRSYQLRKAAIRRWSTRENVLMNEFCCLA